ncbi:class I SAM-dependent methyltransferase [Sporosarcina siberiensis]|uniref:Class I SAM-dependent methyltransferase n=1 Tax=Sporosarcina siberiensis TaxID=1365606 RepID=A0ABW4SG78_9BACL
MTNNYLDLLANFGIGGAHPGGFFLTQSILNKEQIQQFETVLDIGCGTGQTAEYLTKRYGCTVTAVDNHPLMLEKANTRFLKSDSPVIVIEGDIQQLNFQERSYDLILAESVIIFTTIFSTLKKLAGVLKIGGRMILIEMVAEQSLTEDLYEKACSLYGIKEILDEAEWKVKLGQAGFTQIEIIDTPHALTQTEIKDINPSDTITLDYFELWDEHNRFITENSGVLGYRVFRCIL